ncbi:N-acetylmuramic acid 6-phosphate etherase [Gellertiella hungarica]|uniref:N-acetylmuramic acid 6-phosphate etherase n=1 Tax=Gellertiella hungarica TaxID=1572859 RepID=A0A7W6NI23_9HYPH|nr:N-acetylmuramic acid 6-phosphate etherase [Gellertiella hungarica]MBB4062915.1 N-acetylmuramic acid 6-phosphate etherase [Gellertiella hungarica]
MTIERTERRHDLGAALDARFPLPMLDALFDGQIAAATVVAGARDALAAAAGVMAQSVSAGGRLVYVGAGSSGLMAMADALELPGTFGIDPDGVVLLMAGGLPGAGERPALPGGPEDDAEAGARETAALGLGARDTVLALTASGSTPYALAAARTARAAGARVIGLANNADAPLLALSDVAVLLPTPPEVVAGSTRMGAGTAQKIALNMMSTAMAVMLGHVHEGHMVNLKADNQKLRARATRMVSEISGIGSEAAAAHLAAASGSVKIAVLLAAGASGREEAERLLAAGGQHLSAALRALEDRKENV